AGVGPRSGLAPAGAGAEPPITKDQSCRTHLSMRWALQLVRHQVAGTVEVLQRGVGEEIGDARRVKAGVLLHLVAEARLLHGFFEERSPVRMKALVDAIAEQGAFFLQVAQERADALHAALGAPPLRGELGEGDAVFAGLGVGIDLPAEIFVTTLMIA